MASFFKGASVSIAGRRREVVIKESLINNLSECVKAIQFDYQVEEYRHQTIGSNDASNSLCCALEALFLHGLKDSILKKAKNAFSSDVAQKPQPNFWSLILTLSHSDSIKHISSLQQITTEIGQCRSWLRMALNDCLLSSYLSTILKNMSLTKPFYSQHAFIRDLDMLDVAQRYLEGIESGTQFNLPLNSSFLNTWPEDVLVLTGLWIPPIRSCPITAGVDIASTLTDEPEEKKPVLKNEVAITGLGQMIAMDQDEAFNYIVSSISDDIISEVQQDDLNKISNVPSTSTIVDKSESPEENPVIENDPNSIGEADNLSDPFDIDNVEDEAAIKTDLTNIGNCITGKTAWSIDSTDELLSTINSDSSNADKTSDSKSTSSLVDVPPFANKTPNLREVMLGLHKELKLTDDIEIVQNVPVETNQSLLDDPILESLGYEVVSKLPSSEFEVPELKKMLLQVGSLSREYGLDSQDYECKRCRDMLGTVVSKARVCAYSGEYFCSDCMDPNVFMIPARVIHNWDFKRYPVSKRAGLFLLEFQHQPLLNIKKNNPLIYANVDEMATLQLLRIQLNFLRAYLFTCREPVIEELQKRVWPREYLYEQIHMYSVSDLAQIPNGSLANQLQKVVSFAISHVHDCWLCSQKGFVCEVCKNSKVLYPFDIETTYRCEVCSSVYHSRCLNSSKPCPKCERRKKRQNISLVEAVHSNIQ